MPERPSIQIGAETASNWPTSESLKRISLSEMLALSG